MNQVDYVTMYQLERQKLNQKYKEKDEAIRSLSTQLQVNKLALHEISNYLQTFKSYTDKENNKTTTTTLDVVDSKIETNNEENKENEDKIEYIQSKKVYLLARIEDILNQLTGNSSATLNAIASSLVVGNKQTNLRESSRISQSAVNSLSENKSIENNHNHNHNVANLSIDDLNAIAAFRSKASMCSSCYGDLFIV